MKKHTVIIGGREFPMAFTLKTMIRMQEEIPGFNYNEIDKFIATPAGMLDTLYYLMVSGAALEDQTLDVSKDWIGERIPASRTRLAQIQVATIETLADGMAMETEEEENRDREIDVVLEDIKKNGGKTG